ncbi:MAG: hypothetical protein Q7K65_04290 [Candidatus Buchananbacteria bacterium]|nr:hypothetical protein [Candidatus Buchananbacteria bacterium]
MSDYKILALDETGKASFNHLSRNFILSGLIISEKYKTALNAQICELKKKHFNNENIVLHCRDIIRKKGPFAILNGSIGSEINFWSEMIKIIDNKELSIALIITNKDKARNIGWNDIAILKKSYNKILEEFTKKHLVNNKGKILAESDPYQDKYLISAHNKLQSIGIPSEGISSSDYRNKITSLSLVNKLNFDAEIQLADSLAIMADLVYKMKIHAIEKPSDVEYMMIELVDKKIKDEKNPGIFEILV